MSKVKMDLMETRVFVKYDGASEVLQNHQFNAKRLGEALLELNNLIVDANNVINGLDAEEINVLTQAGFHQGSFGIELVVQHTPEAIEVLKAIGLTVSPIIGSLLAILIRKGNKEIKKQDIVIDERSNTAKLSVDGEEIATTPAVVELIKSRTVRKRANKIVAPLEIDGVDYFRVMDSFESDASSIVEVDKDKQKNFTIPSSKKSIKIDDKDTVAVVEFLTSNRNNGNAGWRMLHLGADVPVKITDEVFMESIKKKDAPSIYGMKFKVELNAKISSSESGQNTIYTIKRVISPV